MQGGTTKGFPPGRAEGQEGDRGGFEPPCGRKGTDHISTGRREGRKAGFQVFETPSLTLRSSASRHSGDSALCSSNRLYATSRCRSFLSCSRPGAEVRKEEGHVSESKRGGVGRGLGVQCMLGVGWGGFGEKITLGTSDLLVSVHQL